ncbi:hypothetical protein [Enterobacter hormaechei]|uniref:hypothetical protein n=1 Tax=Enterobacter hormaechei TaxID=158836 RepID=UPI0005F1E80F|nr:hypothetical protein [Enterobacter hormaechei]KJL64223.1 hypothetical protein SS38_24420 [Enterobacter hormaechei subsp. xiangfangensis]
MSNIDKRAQKELYAKVERQAHSLRGNPREYQAVTGLCPVNVIEMHAQKIQALLDELEAKDQRVAELSHHLQSAHAFVEHTEAFGHAASNGILCCGDAQWNIDASKSVLAAAGKGEVS